MEPNPYQSPVHAHYLPSNRSTLLLPALGCIIVGLLATVPTVGHFLSSVLHYSDSISWAGSPGTWRCFWAGCSGVPFAVLAFAMAGSMLKRSRKSLIVAGIIFWIVFSPLWLFVVVVDPDKSADHSDLFFQITGGFGTLGLVAFAGYGLWRWSNRTDETQPHKSTNTASRV